MSELGCISEKISRGGTPQSPNESRTFAQVVVSAHVGDLDHILSVEVFRRAIRDLLDFFKVKPDAIACDLHPDYASTRYAEELASQWDVPLLRVQHHHAHVAACMAEHGLQGPVLGFSWDGTGYGPDGTVWGGEALWCDDASFRRVARLRTFAIPGGDLATREPRRSAFGLLHAMLGEGAADYGDLWFTGQEVESLGVVLNRGLNAPQTSSMGRLFDAVAAMVGLMPVISFEGQAAMALEYAADTQETSSYRFAVHGQDPCTIDWEPVVRAILEDRTKGVSVGRISMRFHKALAEMAVEVAQLAGCRQVVLSGGCFQNRLLSELVYERLLAAGYNGYTHKNVPPGDGGISLGQVFLALRQL